MAQPVGHNHPSNPWQGKERIGLGGINLRYRSPIVAGYAAVLCGATNGAEELMCESSLKSFFATKARKTTKIMFWFLAVLFLADFRRRVLADSR